MSYFTISDAELLTAACVSISGVYINADRIVSAGHLLEAGFVNADDDYDGVVIWPTTAGVKHAEALGIIELVGNKWLKKVSA